MKVAYMVNNKIISCYLFTWIYNFSLFSYSALSQEVKITEAFSTLILVSLYPILFIWGGIKLTYHFSKKKSVSQLFSSMVIVSSLTIHLLFFSRLGFQVYLEKSYFLIFSFLLYWTIIVSILTLLISVIYIFVRFGNSN
jgi:hypothetical protein